ncbi:MAG: hypothetical protein JXA20_12715 [Spirochaetes bacterium]|nr:hypothetical protein [Spirochaetota bacterium]
MEKVTIWYLTDNEKNEPIRKAIAGLGLNCTVIRGIDLEQAYIIDDDINIFIFDLADFSPDAIIAAIEKDRRIHSSVKLLIMKASDLRAISKRSYNFIHMEIITRPLRKRDFLLLLEKTIIVERYREIMKNVSKEAESRIEAFEGLMDINRNNVFESESEKKVFEKILAHEKNLLSEQMLLNETIRGFSMLRQSELFDMKNRIRAEEMLTELRRRELMDAKNVIEAQESVINFSAQQLHETKKIIMASESVQELSRSEAIRLHDELKRQKELNRSLSDEVDRLLKELDMLKEKQDQG